MSAVVPLITDIKCAKLFVEALRTIPRGAIVSDVDCQVCLPTMTNIIELDGSLLSIFMCKFHND
jgi:hypothetical protein